MTVIGSLITSVTWTHPATGPNDVSGQWIAEDPTVKDKLALFFVDDGLVANCSARIDSLFQSLNRSRHLTDGHIAKSENQALLHGPAEIGRRQGP